MTDPFDTFLLWLPFLLLGLVVVSLLVAWVMA